MYSDSSVSNGDGCKGCAKILLNEKRLSGETITSDYGELTSSPFCLSRSSQSCCFLVVSFSLHHAQLGTAIEFNRRMSAAPSDHKFIWTVLSIFQSPSPFRLTSDILYPSLVRKDNVELTYKCP